MLKLNCSKAFDRANMYVGDRDNRAPLLNCLEGDPGCV